MIARIATFEGGDADEMRRRNNEMLVERATELPAGIRRVMVLVKDESRWSVISFFDSEDAAAAAEERFEQMGDEIPESVRGKRVSLETFEVAFDVEMIGNTSMAPVSPRASACRAESSLAEYGLAACSDIRTRGGVGSVRRKCQKLERQRFSPDILAPSTPWPACVTARASP